MTNISTLPWGDGAGSLWFNRNLSHRHLYSWSQVSNTFSTVKSVTYFGTSVYQRPDADEMGNDLPAGEAGEILIRGVNVLSGYWRNETATRETLRDGWYHSGDIGYRDEAGYYFVVDRKKNMIKSGGESIYPAEIERVLFEHPAVVEVAVFGVPDDKWQEIPVALVVTAKDASQRCQPKRRRVAQLCAESIRAL